MSILAIDTAASRTSVVVIENGKVVFNEFRDGAMSHGPALPELVKAAIRNREITEVLVGMGPGPYTGLRVGITFAQTFAWARNIPVRGFCSLDAIAAQVTEPDFIVTIDARRKEVYWARYTNGLRFEGPAVDLPAVVAARGIKVVSELVPDPQFFTSLSEEVTDPIYLRRPDAVATADRK
jgi:tRNA threonylcarbamoyl adenosine modification protein YeaZ